MAESKGFSLSKYLSKVPFAEVSVGFIIFTSYLFMNQTDALAPQFQSMYNIPVQSLSIFLSKLYSIRTICVIVGSAIQHLLITYFDSRITDFTIVLYTFVYSLRLLYMIWIYTYTPLLKMYILLNLEAFFFGAFHTSFLSMVTQFMPTVLLCICISAFFPFLLQRPLNHLYSGNPLKMIKIHGWLCLTLSSVTFGSLAYYLFHYHRFTPSYKTTINEIKSAVDTFRSIITDIRNETNGLFYNYSRINTLDKTISALFRDTTKISNLRGISHESDIMFVLLRELKDKTKQLLDVIEFGRQVSQRKLYNLRVPLRPKMFQELNEAMKYRKSWDMTKSYFEAAKHSFVFRYKTPINYEYSDHGQIKKNVETGSTEYVKNPVAKSSPGNKAHRIKKHDLESPKSKSSEEEKVLNVSYSPVKYAGQQKTTGSPMTEKSEDLEPTPPPQVTEAESTTSKQTPESEKNETQVTKRTSAPETGEKVELELNGKTQRPDSSINGYVPSTQNANIKDDQFELRLKKINSELDKLRDEIINVYNLVKKWQGIKDNHKDECTTLIHEVESKVINMDSQFNEMERILTDKIKFEYHHAYSELKNIHYVEDKDPKKMFEDKDAMRKVFLRNRIDAISPFLMFFIATLFKDFIFPKTFFYSFMVLNGKDAILMAGTTYTYGAVLILILDRLADHIRTWNEAYNLFWIMIIPIVTVFISTVLAVNTNIPKVREVFSSDGKLLLVTTCLLMFGSVMKYISYVGVANYVYYQSGDVLGNLKYFTSFHISAIFFQFLVRKLSIRTQPKVYLGFRFLNLPVQRNLGGSTLLLWLREGFKSSFKESLADILTTLWRYI